MRPRPRHTTPGLHAAQVDSLIVRKSEFESELCRNGIPRSAFALHAPTAKLRTGHPRQAVIEFN